MLIRCLYNANITETKVQSRYDTAACSSYDLTTTPPTCASYVTLTQSVLFQPTFNYSNQCRNAYLRNYIPVIIYQSIYVAFLQPLIMLFMMTREYDNMWHFFRALYPVTLWPTRVVNKSFSPNQILVSAISASASAFSVV